MIRVRIRTPIAGDHGDHPADSVVHFPPHVAKQIIDGNFGVAVEDHAGEVLDDDQGDEMAGPAPAASPARKKKGKATEAPAPPPAPINAGLDESEWSTE